MTSLESHGKPQTYTLFHFSDMHVGTELAPTNAITAGLNAHDIEIWARFKNHLLNRIRNTNGKYSIIVTGDLSQFGNLKSFSLAEKFIFWSDSDISQDVGLMQQRDRVVIVPGNHDACDNNAFSKNSLINFNKIFFPNDEPNSVYPYLHPISTGDIQIGIVVLDSTYKKSIASPSKKFGKGTLYEDQLDKASALLAQLDHNFVKIVCLHHSPIILDKDRKRNLMLMRSHNFLQWLIKNKIDIVLCGHLHDDFYDVLPLSALVKYLPVKKRLEKIKMKFFKETHLNNFHQIEIDGKKAKYLDSIIYHIIKKTKNDIKKPSIGNFLNINRFVKYLRGLDEYKNVLNSFKAFGKSRTALILTGSVCQIGEKKGNSYIEISFERNLRTLSILRHKYNKQSMKFETKQRDIEFRI